MLDVTKRQTAPFDTARLDRLMDEAGFDVLVVTSKHNVQYLLGGQHMHRGLGEVRSRVRGERRRTAGAIPPCCANRNWIEP